MASVRIEDEARRDPRFVLLGKRMGTSRFDARARMEELWAYCTDNQTYFMSEEVIDVCAEFDGFAKLIVSDQIGLAEVTEKGIRIKGTRGRIEWLKKLRENGRKGGRPKKTKTKPEGNQTETRTEPPSNPLTPTPIPSLVPIPTLTQEQEKKEKQEIQKSSPRGDSASRTQDEPESLTKKFLGLYVDQYRLKYGEAAKPPIGGKTAGIAKRVVKDLGLPRASQLLCAYFNHPDRYYEQRGHDLVLFEQQLVVIARAVDTGIVVDRMPKTKAEIGGDYNARMHERILKGEV